MTTRFSVDVVPVTDMKVNPGKIVRQVNETRRPVLLTSRGRGVAVIQSVEEYERGEEEKSFIRAIAQGLADEAAGRVLTLEEVKARLGIE
jgi:prevent-host-death family protein